MIDLWGGTENLWGGGGEGARAPPPPQPPVAIRPCIIQERCKGLQVHIQEFSLYRVQSIFQDFALINRYLFSPCWIEHLFLIILL